MQILIKEKKQFKYLPIGIGIIVLFAVSPFIVMILGYFIGDLISTGLGKDFLIVWWFSFFTIPLAILALIIFIGIVIHDFVLLRREGKLNKEKTGI
jgi:hypothetical protein